MKNCIILVPSLSPSGPIKGAVALANGLSVLGVCVTLIPLRSGSGVNSEISPSVKIVDSGFKSNLSTWSMIKLVTKITRELNPTDKSQLALISMCFSADFVNLFSGGNKIRISSVRGDLSVNYSMDNKYTGKLLSYLHYFILKFFDSTFAMNREMLNLLEKKKCKNVFLVPNFLNERDLESYRSSSASSGSRKVLFLGSLSERKRPELVIQAVAELNKQGKCIDLEMVGDGPLMEEMLSLVASLNDERIKITGFSDSPTVQLKSADIFVLPSVSEGTPRAVMEALYLGLPCVMRNLSTNDNLVIEGVNGAVFDDDDQLAPAILRALDLKKNLPNGSKLLGSSFSQDLCSRDYLEKIESLSSSAL